MLVQLHANLIVNLNSITSIYSDGDNTLVSFTTNEGETEQEFDGNLVNEMMQVISKAQSK